MENALSCSEYKEFRDKLSGNVPGRVEISDKIRAAIPALARKVHIGKIEVSLLLPSTPTEKANHTEKSILYIDENGFGENALIETFRTGENGIETINFHPQKGLKFTSSEIEAIKLLACDIFMLTGRAHLIQMAQKAKFTDTMTGIPNLPSMVPHGIELKVSKKIQDFVGIFINLKNYKYINQAFGPSAGDYGIIRYAQAICAFLTGDERAARLGGDNFFVLVLKKNFEDFMHKFKCMEVPFQQGPFSGSFHIHARMGVYPITEKDTLTQVIHFASIAISYAKKNKNSDIAFFNMPMLENELHEKEISTLFQTALEKREFTVFYQPKVNLDDRTLCGAEALVRWNRNGEIIAPAEFLPILEKESSICQLDLFVFDTVCTNLRRWIDEGIEPVRISSNFSKLHLRNPNLADDILGIMRKHDIDSQYIEVELTEVSDFEDSQAMQQFVSRLRVNGVSVSIDDFGTGYSTLNVLKDYDVNIIKLDKSLLDHIGENKFKDEIVLKNMVSMMNELDKEVIAEGVENETQVNFLKKIHCGLVQGFIYDRPMPAEEFEKRLKDGRAY